MCMPLRPSLFHVIIDVCLICLYQLMYLQSRYGTDGRFKLDAHFADSDSDSAGSDLEQEGVATTTGRKVGIN